MARTLWLAVAIAAMPTLMLAQDTAGWRPCPRCQSDRQQEEAAARVKGQKFNPRELGGPWGNNGLAFSAAPPMTPAGQAKYDAAKPGMGPRAVPLGNDPMMICDPLGYPRLLNYNYGMEFVHLPDRVLQVFEFGHTFRTIWTDGRKLQDDPEPRWLGYAVGRWDGDTFVVESNGFDDRTWLTTQGHQHSTRMRLTERFRRTAADTLEVTLTIDDPEMYTKPWVTTGRLRLMPAAEVGEYFCVPSEEEEYRKTVREPAGGVVRP
jgi:hypothetical protein